jgi:hypothetical protein
MSLLAVLGFSSITLVPGLGAESWRTQMMFAGGAFFVGWLYLAIWARARERIASTPPWLSRLWVIVGVLYALGIALFAIG